MQRWHPATRLLVGVAILALPYLAWTSFAETPAPAVGAVAPPQDGDPPQPDHEPAEEPLIQRLPPLERFAAIVERPLFSPTRRPEPVGTPPPADDGAADPVPVATGPDEPGIRFVGTVGQGGSMTAVVIRADSGDALRLATGDTIEGWEVAEVTTSELVLRREERRLVLTILQ
jgi:general secretion pathway protein N